MGYCEPCQVREEAALSGISHVPQIRLLPAARCLRAKFLFGPKPWANPTIEKEVTICIWHCIGPRGLNALKR